MRVPRKPTFDLDVHSGGLFQKLKDLVEITLGAGIPESRHHFGWIVERSEDLASGRYIPVIVLVVLLGILVVSLMGLIALYTTTRPDASLSQPGSVPSSVIKGVASALSAMKACVDNCTNTST